MSKRFLVEIVVCEYDEDDENGCDALSHPAFSQLRNVSHPLSRHPDFFGSSRSEFHIHSPVVTLQRHAPFPGRSLGTRGILEDL